MEEHATDGQRQLGNELLVDSKRKTLLNCLNWNPKLIKFKLNNNMHSHRA